MFNAKFFSAAIVSLMVMLMATSAFAGDWEHIDTTDGVWVYKKDAGDDVMFRGTMRANVGIGELLTVHSDPSHRPHWVSSYADHETLERGANSETYWLKLDMPFGVTNRDYVLESNYQFNESNRTVTSVIETVEHDAKPEQDCCVRARTRTEYTFQAADEDTTVIEVVVQTDLKGRVPSRVVNSAQRDWPVETLTSLVERASGSGIEADSRVDGWQ